jgi:photosystem II stability/assembly factor-like uncharacterized protein
MPTASTGYAVAGAQILRTTDGGATWLLGGFVGSGGAAPSRIAFGTAEVGYAPTGNGLYATADGGATWTLALAGSWLDVHAFADGVHAVAVGPSGPIRTTADGGATWTVRSSPGATLLAVTCPTTSRCFAAGSFGAFQVSDDAGATWTARPSGIAADIVAVAFADPAQGWALDATGALHRTTDAGTTWTAEPDPVIAGASAIVAMGAARAWVVGEGGLVASTADGGATWSRVGTRQILSGPGTIHALGPTTVLAAGSSGVLRSVDAGAGWTAAAYPGGGTAYAPRLAFANESVGVAVHPYAYSTLRTDDGGASWLPGGAFPAYDVTGVSCLPDDPSAAPPPRCFAGTRGSGLYRTVDGGDTWFAASAPGGDVSSVAFLDETRGFIWGSGNAGYGLYITADGGFSWWLAGMSDFGDVTVVPPSTVVSGSRVSYDGGATWTRMPIYGRKIGAGLAFDASYSVDTFAIVGLAPGFPGHREGYFPAGVTLTDVAIADVDTWYALDAAGVVWKTTTGGR